MTTEEIILNEEEWEEFQPNQALSPELSGKLWNNVNKVAAGPTARISRFKWLAVAASLILVIGLSWTFIIKRQKAGSTGAAPIASTENISNPSPQKKTVTLSDGSTVELSPNSTIAYTGSKREVVLKGEALFDIAKDEARPFYVHSNSIRITVLGTRFTVDSYDSNKTTKVILHQGRVMVNIPDASSKDPKKEYYLTPGDIFIFRKNTRSTAAHILHLEEDKDHGYVFNNYPLDVVFDQLQIIYNTKIIYNKAELGNRTFIGKIDKKDSLPHILKSITLLNKFGLQKQGDSFIIGTGSN